MVAAQKVKETEITEQDSLLLVAAQKVKETEITEQDSLLLAAQKVKETEITEQDSLLLTRNLLRIAIFNISYVRGLSQKYFNDKSVPAFDMMVKKLLPLGAESCRLLDWMEKGVSDALLKKYLKKLSLYICEWMGSPIEEYTFSFSYPNSNSQEISMKIERRGTRRDVLNYVSSVEITTSQMRSPTYKMIHRLTQLMRPMDELPEKRAVLMTLVFYDDVTPMDYVSPLFHCFMEEAYHLCDWIPLKMEVGKNNSKLLVLALKVKSVLDTCEDEKDDDLDNTQDLEKHELQSGLQVKDWICSYHLDTIELNEVLSNFPAEAIQKVNELEISKHEDSPLQVEENYSFLYGNFFEVESGYVGPAVDVQLVNSLLTHNFRMEASSKGVGPCYSGSSRHYSGFFYGIGNNCHVFLEDGVGNKQERFVRFGNESHREVPVGLLISSEKQAISKLWEFREPFRFKGYMKVVIETDDGRYYPGLLFYGPDKESTAVLGDVAQRFILKQHLKELYLREGTIPLTLIPVNFKDPHPVMVWISDSDTETDPQLVRRAKIKRKNKLKRIRVKSRNSWKKILTVKKAKAAKAGKKKIRKSVHL